MSYAPIQDNIDLLCSYLSPTPAPMALLCADMDKSDASIKMILGAARLAGIDIVRKKDAISVSGDAFALARRRGQRALDREWREFD